MIYRAFTLLELLVVITIIGILASIVVVSMSGSTDSATIAKGKAYAQQIHALLGANAVGIWNFDEGTGTTLTDISGYGNDGNAYGNPEWIESNIEGTALTFDGTDDRVELGSGDNLDMGTDNRSYEVWIKLADESYSSALTLFASGVGGGGLGVDGVWALIINSGSVSVYFSDGTASRLSRTFSTNKSLFDGEWHHIVMIFDRDAYANLYCDGLVSSSNPLDISSQQGEVNDIYTQRLGAYPSTQYPFKGNFDEVKIYNAVFSATEVKKHYAQGLEKLLADQAITKAEYAQRIEEFNQSLVSNRF